MYFKAAKTKSYTCGDYRRIIKREEDNEKIKDSAFGSDDVIYIDVRDISFIRIDCDKKTGEFHIFV